MVSIENRTVLEVLEKRRAALKAEIWTVATEVAASTDPALLTQLVRLKADLEAIDFAITLCPQGGPEAHINLMEQGS